VTGPGVPSKPVVIDAWFSDHPIPHFLDPVKKIAEEFNRDHPGYDVRIRGVGFRDLPREIAQAAAGGNLPDIAEYYFACTQLARDMRGGDGEPLFIPVQQAIGGRTEILGEPVVIDDLTPAVRDYYSDREQLLSMPVLATQGLLYANKNLLDRAGIERVPRTWAEVEDACAAVTRLPGGPAHGITWPNHGWIFQMEVAAQGGLLCDNDNGRSGRATRINLTSPELLSYVRWWQRLHQDGHYLYASRTDWEPAMHAFNQQEVAFLVNSSMVNDLTSHLAADAGFEVEVGRMPYNGEKPYAGQTIGGQSLWLANGLSQAKQDGALAFMQYLINPSNGAIQPGDTGTLPVSTAAFNHLAAEGCYDKNPSFRVPWDQVDASDRSPAALGALVGDFARIQDVITAAMDDVLNGAADPLARFTQATGEAQALLDRYNAPCLTDPPATPDAFVVGL
jgi:sn-glycerol 3-phosphate transport system substrate-binding protein